MSSRGSNGLSLDLRLRVLEAWKSDKSLTYKQLADRFGIGEATISRWRRLYRETGAVEPRPHGGGRRRVIKPEQEPLVEKLVLEHPDWTEVEYQEALGELGIQASRATVGRVIRSLGYTVKKRPSLPPSETKTMSEKGDLNTSRRSETSPFRVWFSWTKPAQTSR